MLCRVTTSRLTIILFGLLSSHVNVVECSCLGVTVCNCESSTLSRYQVINCRNVGLMSVPKFTPSHQQSSVYYHELTLASNYIRTIQADAFRNVSVEILDLSGNPISVIDPQSFSGLDPVLRKLFISLSTEAPFPAIALAAIRSITTLRVAGFAERSLPRGALYGLSVLAELELINGRLMNVTADDLIDQRLALQRLSLSGNSLTSVPSVAIGDMLNLRSLDLSRNRLTRIEPKAFGAGLVRIETIDLSNNGLGSNVDERAFDDMADSLTSIRLQNCQLTDRSVVSLKPLSRALREIRLDYNSIASLPNDLLNDMRALRILNLDNNRSANGSITLTTIYKPFDFY
jgi:Leucine-rich repeat (LRR) protein